MKNKREIDRAVAVLLGTSEREVSGVTLAFLNEVMRAIVEEGEVHVDGFGRFRLVRDHFDAKPVVLTRGTFRKGEAGETHTAIVRKKYRIYFSKAGPFKRAIREKFGRQEDVMDNDGMTKLGVDEGQDQERLEKAASHGCPECGGRVTQHGGVASCENCGTAPFEKRSK